MRKPLYTRLPPLKHRLLAEYALSSGKSVSNVIEAMVDQLLFQAVPGYQPPPWLLRAVRDGLLEIEPCEGQGGTMGVATG